MHLIKLAVWDIMILDAEPSAEQIQTFLNDAAFWRDLDT